MLNCSLERRLKSQRTCSWQSRIVYAVRYIKYMCLTLLITESLLVATLVVQRVNLANLLSYYFVSLFKIISLYLIFSPLLRLLSQESGKFVLFLLAFLILFSSDVIVNGDARLFQSVLPSFVFVCTIFAQFVIISISLLKNNLSSFYNSCCWTIFPWFCSYVSFVFFALVIVSISQFSIYSQCSHFSMHFINSFWSREYVIQFVFKLPFGSTRLSDNPDKCAY